MRCFFLWQRWSIQSFIIIIIIVIFIIFIMIIVNKKKKKTNLFDKDLQVWGSVNVRK